MVCQPLDIEFAHGDAAVATTVAGTFGTIEVGFHEAWASGQGASEKGRAAYFKPK